MKIVEVNCPSCGARLNPQNSQSGLITCEYCGNQFLLDQGRTQNITNYNFYGNQPIRVYQDPAAARKDKAVTATALAVAGGCFLLFICLLVIAVGISSSSPRHSGSQYAASSETYFDYGGAAEPEEETVPASPLYDAITEEMFGKTKGVTPQDLSKVKYLKIDFYADETRVWYSFDDPYTDNAEIRTAVFSGLGWDDRNIENFTGLVFLDIGSLSQDVDLSVLTQLKGLSADGMELSEIADMVADPGQITELDLRHIDSIEGIVSFANLERLSVENLPDTNLKQLVALKHLKMLTLVDTVISDSLIPDDDVVRVTDFTAVSVMTGLESLSISSDRIKDVGFLKGLPNLTVLSLENSSVISVEPLAELTGLESLRLAGNNEIKDYASVGRMTWLKELTIDKMTYQTDPDLSGLTGLEKLDICGFMSVSSLRGLQNLRELSIHSCNIDGAEALSTLTGVERLTFYSVWNSSSHYIQSIQFLDGMTNLKYVDFNGNLDGSGWIGYDYGLQAYGDVSSIFNHQGLEELYLNAGKFEINFDRIKENPSLRVLAMNGMELHENYYVEAYNGMVDAWYDDVDFSEHLDFLAKFPNLQELYLDSNELTDLEFVRELKNLSRLSVKDNYITDLSPLVQAEHLKYLNISENPAGDLKGIEDDVEIVK